MTSLQQQLASLTAYPADTLHWVALVGGDAFDYPIDYSVAVLGTDEKSGRADFLVKWQPKAYCHFHKHCGNTTVVVLEGEHHVIEDHHPTETVHKIRKPGHVTRNPPGDLHMERGGAQGSTLFFSMQADDGVLFEFLGRDGRLLRTVTVRDLATGNV